MSDPYLYIVTLKIHGLTPTYIWTPALAAGSYEITPVRQSVCQSVCQSVSNHSFSELAPTIFLISCMKLGVHKRKKVTEPDFSGKIPFPRFWGKRGQKCPFWAQNRFFDLFLLIRSNDFSDFQCEVRPI